MKPSSLFASLLYCITIFSSCSSTDCDNNCVNKDLNCNCSPKLDSQVLAKPNLKHINIFLETSGSMKGFMPSGSSASAFQQVIPNIVAKLKNASSTSFFLIKESSQKPIALNPDQAE